MDYILELFETKKVEFEDDFSFLALALTLAGQS